MDPSIPDRLYAHVLTPDPADEYDDPPSQMVLSPHEDDPCDAVCFGYEYHGDPPGEEQALFAMLAEAWNRRERRQG